MKTGTKVMATLIAVSLLTPTQTWAASKKENHQQALERWKAEQKLILPEAWNVHKPISQLDIQQLLPSKLQPQQKIQADKPLLQQLKGKKKSVSVKQIPNEMAQALKNVYKILPELKNMKLTSAEILFETDENPELWGFDFIKEDAKGHTVEEAGITLLEKDGSILGYYYDSDNSNPGKTPTEKEAKDKATSFVNKALGAHASKYVLQEVSIWDGGEYGEGEADVEFARTIHEVPYEDEGIRVALNGEGQVIRYYCSYGGLTLDESVFPDPKNAIKTSSVKSSYLKLEKMTTAYRNEEVVEVNDKTDEITTKPVLKYVPSFTGPMNAITGEQVVYRVDGEKAPEVVNLQPEGKVLTASSRAEGEAILKDQFNIDVTDWEFDQYPEDDDEEADSDYRHYNWYTFDEDRDEEIYLTVYKKTNQVLSFSHEVYTGEEEDGPLLSEDEAKQAALKALQPYAKSTMNEAQLTLLEGPIDVKDLPDWVDEDQLPEYWNNESYWFVLNEMYQGVPIEDSQYYIQVDGHTGDILDMTFADANTHVTLPDNKNTVTPAKAASAFGSNLVFQKEYIWPSFFDQQAPKPLLIYTPTPRYDGYIDAFTGRLVRVKVTK